MSDAPTRRSLLSLDRRWIALVVFVFALGLRLIGIDWGLPNALHNQSYHPDEPIIWIYSQQVNPAGGDFDPGFYNYGTLYLSLLRVATDITHAYVSKPDPNDPDGMWKLIGSYHLAGRVISAVAGAVTVLWVWLISRRIMNPFGAIFAALAVAVAPGHVVHSRFQTVDVLAACFLVGSAFFALRLLPGREDEVEPWSPMRLAVLSGVLAGLSAGTKYTGILALVTLWVVLFMSKPKYWTKCLVLGTVGSVLVFVVSTPGILINTSKFMQDFVYEMQHTSAGHGMVFAATRSGFVFHLLNLFEGFGMVMTLLGLGGLVWAVWKRQPWAIALFAFFLLYYVLIGRAEVKFLRYTFPLYLGLAVGFGWLVAQMHERTDWKRGLVVLAIAGLMGLDGTGLRSALMYTLDMTRQDPRDEVAAHLKQVTAGTTDSVGIVSDAWFYTPALYKDVGLPRSVPFEERLRLQGEAKEPRVVQSLPANPAERFDWDARLVTEIRPERIVFSSFEYQDPLRLRGVPGLRPEIQVQVDRCKAFTDVLNESYTLEKVFGSPGALIHDMQYVRPLVWVWKRNEP